MFQFQWLRRLVRRHTKPIPEDHANVWKQRLSYLYMFLAWNAFGIVAYNMSTGKANWATYYGLPKDAGTPAQQWTKALGIKEATVYRISGTQVDKYHVKNEFDDQKKEAISSLITRDKDMVKNPVAEQLIE